jgi:hypothetical protein
LCVQITKQLSALALDPKYCTYAYLDSDVSVPEIVLSCVMFLRHAGHVPGLLLVHPDAALTTKLMVRAAEAVFMRVCACV